MFKEFKKVIKDTEILSRLLEVEDAVKEYATATDDEKDDIKNWMVDVISSDCKHDAQTEDYDGVVCGICHAYTECYADMDEDGMMVTSNYEWSSADLETLYKEPISKLSLKCMDVIKGNV